MKTPNSTTFYKRHWVPAEITSQCVWQYFRFCLSYRDIERLTAPRGLMQTYGGVRYWCRKFEAVYANPRRWRRPNSGGKWHLDEVSLR